ncbi:hypothetical protein Tco_1445141 [Tanacetum coccineum]
MIPRTDLCFDVHNDGYFSHLPLSYVNGVIFNMSVPRMPYEEFAEYLEEKYENYFQVITPEMDACVSKTIGPPKKRYCNDFSMDEIVDWAEMEVEQQGGSSQHLQKIDNDKEKVSQDEIGGVKARTSTVDSKFDSEMEANREAKAKGNSVSEMNEPNDENSMPADNVRGETFKEHDIYMNELLTRLKTTDEDGKTQDPFISVEKYVEKYPMYDETTQWRLRKPKVGKKYVTVEQFKECLTYYALANGFVLWYERSSRKKVVAKCGQRPPRLSVHEKGNKESKVADIVMKKYKCKVTPNQCTNAKKYALIEYEKTVGERYAMLRSYGKAILDSNPGSTVKLGVTVNPDDKTYFDRFYVCFAGLTDGWKTGCRKIIALDGCFLKSPNQGEILTAIGRGGNNHIYPVAWAVVNIENKDN